MNYLILLTVVTVISSVLTFLVWKRCREFSFIVGFGLIYFFSLYGAWFIVLDELAGKGERAYLYLYDRIIELRLDASYFQTLLYYSLFLLIVQASVYFFLKDNKNTQPVISKPLFYLRTHYVLILGAGAVLLSMLIIKEQLAEALAAHSSAYYSTRVRTPLFTLHQILNRVAIFPAAIGLSVLITGKSGRFIVCRSSPILKVSYVMFVIGIYGYMVMLGNKNELLVASLAAFLFFIANSTKISPRKLIGFGVVVIAMVSAIDGFRALSPTEYFHSVQDLSFLWRASTAFVRSNEAIGAHMSLYAALSLDVPLTYGYSLYSFVLSFIPRLFWPDRPGDIYEYYASEVNVVPGQGYAIHHAAGWYLNFGIWGVVFGALLLGYIWVKLYDNFRNISLLSCKGRAGFLLKVLSPWFFVAGIAPLMRCGPEGYKGVIVDSFIIPIFTLWFVTGRLKSFNLKTRKVTKSELRYHSKEAVAQRVAT